MTHSFFDPIKTPLQNGINLIEASAGTGKTYAIAMLVVRFVVEQGVDIKKLLVVTYTKAATEELKERIRARLSDAQAVLLGATEQIDPLMLAWFDSLSLDQALIKSRLELALLDIDQAGIFTIHGFCQRVLHEHALESGELFDSELTGEVATIKQACADDFWRLNVYPRPNWEAALLTEHFANPDALLASVSGINPQTRVFPDTLSLEQLLIAFRAHCTEALHQLPTLSRQLRSFIADGTFKGSFSDTFEAKCQQLSVWLALLQMHTDTALPDECALLPDFEFLTLRAVKEGLNGNKFRATKTQTGEQRKQDYLNQADLDFSAFDTLAIAYQQIGLAFRRALLDYLARHLDQQMQFLNVLSFDDLINRLAEALSSGNADFLKTELQQKFLVALIDEFQDTDQQQWYIFSQLFAHDSHSLYLIGDPKQAIYKFRGADIYSYFEAQQQAKHHYTLGYNWRSHPCLVNATNRLFARAQPFLFEQLNFTPVQPGLSEQDGYLAFEDQKLAPLQLWQLAESDAANGYWTRGKAATEIRLATVNEILRLLKEPYQLHSKIEPRALQPRDIAILVRTNQQARDFQQCLREAGIPAVLNSTESVFSSPEALDLYRLLQAIANPGDLNLLKQALTLRWFALNGQQLYQTFNDETMLDSWIFRFQEYHQSWQNKGFMAMMKQLISAEKIAVQLSKSRLAERQLTNLQHLLELVQLAILNEHLGIHKALDWLRSSIIKAQQHKNSAEEQQLRLESDEDSVKIVTLHRSKGLEYPIVFCPTLWQRGDFIESERHVLHFHQEAQMLADIGSPDFERHRAQALEEELAEDLRIFYVAVTRAKYRCYLAWADVRTKDKPNASAMAYLFEFSEADFAQQQQSLQALATEQPDAFTYEQLARNQAITDQLQNLETTETLSARQRKRNLYTSWQMSSYTALSALSLADAPELPEDKVNESIDMEVLEDLMEATEDLPSDALPRGIKTGNVIHTLLEKLEFTQCSDPGKIAPVLENTCRKFGLNLNDPYLITQLLSRIVETPLSADDPQFRLQNIDPSHSLKEMPFYLSMQALDAAQINQILEECPAFKPLTAKQMRGYLTGFIDLVCQYNDRYYVIDYKTNSLPDYRPESLTHAMREHNYGLQYWLYSVVLHRYLEQRLPGYRYAKHFGGVRYLFVRGMQPEQLGFGIYEDFPQFETLQRLTALFGGE